MRPASPTRYAAIARGQASANRMRAAEVETASTPPATTLYRTIGRTC